MDTEQRNRLRAEASLPLLSVAAETKRLQMVQASAEFERQWDTRKSEFAQWISGGQGWFGKMGRWSVARQQVRQDMRKAQGPARSGQ